MAGRCMETSYLEVAWDERGRRSRLGEEVEGLAGRQGLAVAQLRIMAMVASCQLLWVKASAQEQTALDGFRPSSSPSCASRYQSESL